jgi:hypothetical protein
MISPSKIEQAVLSLLCFSTEQASLFALKVTDQKFFTNRTNKAIAKTALDYISKYSTAPQMQLEALLETELRRGEEGILLRKTIEELQILLPSLDPKFIYEELDQFLESQTLTLHLTQALELLQEGDLAKAKETMYKQSLRVAEGTPGIWLTDPRQSLKFMDADEEGDFFSSGIDYLDTKGIRPDRKTFLLMMAAAKKGKSWFLVQCGRSGIQFRHKVLHVTLELSEDKTSRRYIQSLFGLTSSVAMEIKTTIFQYDRATESVRFDVANFQRNSVYAEKKDIQDKLLWSRGELLIKEFPTGTLSTEHLLLYLDTLKRERGFVPDLIILDYADLMKLDARELRIDTGRLYKELRGISGLGYALVSASQGNRDSANAKVVDVTNVAEDWSKIGTVDVILTYNQTAAEKQLGLARIFVAGGRDAEDRFMTLISQSYDTGQFAISSTPMNLELADKLAAMTS